MRFQDIIGIVREYFILAMLAVIVLAIAYFIGYYIIYRKLLKGKKRVSKKKLLIGGLFIGYVIMVLGVTILNRGINDYNVVDLSLFSTYKEAWYSFSLRHWQFVILNIFMFIPFGILLPLLHSRFKRAIWTIGAGMLFSLSIESFQLLTKLGNFVLDDLFNNTLGAVIGYGITMGLITIKSKGIKQSTIYFSPLLLVVLFFVSLFTYYHMKEFGNLSIVPIQKVNMTQATLTIDIEFNENGNEAPVYKAPSYSRETADEFVINFLEKMNVDASNMEVMYYQDVGFYSIHGNESYSIWFSFVDGGFQYTDFSSLDEGIEPKEVEKEILTEYLEHLRIPIPEDAQFQKIETGNYEWSIEKKVIENQLINGVLNVWYYNDDTIKKIGNRIITYDKVRDVQIISEQEAFEELVAGNFRFYSENNTIESLHIYDVEISYHIDSKGYYQPVYAFTSTLNGYEIVILIPAKK